MGSFLTSGKSSIDNISDTGNLKGSANFVANAKAQGMEEGKDWANRLWADLQLQLQFMSPANNSSVLISEERHHDEAVS